MIHLYVVANLTDFFEFTAMSHALTSNFRHKCVEGRYGQNGFVLKFSVFFLNDHYKKMVW